MSIENENIDMGTNNKTKKTFFGVPSVFILIYGLSFVPAFIYFVREYDVYGSPSFQLMHYIGCFLKAPFWPLILLYNLIN